MQITSTQGTRLFLVFILPLFLILHGNSFILAQTTPAVNGLFYGDEDVNLYTFLSNDNTGGANLYYALDPPNKTVYVAAVYEDGDDGDGLAEASDNVFAWGSGNPYTAAVGWNHHNFDHVIGSDHAQIMIRCGPTEYIFKVDLLYNNAMDNCDYTQGQWLADVYGPDGDATNIPPDLKSGSSAAWNMIHTSWDVDQGGCNPSKDWMSPDEDGNNSPMNDGYPYFNTDLKWEWSTVYEISFDYSFCSNTGYPLEVGIWDLHTSPWKPDWTPPASPLIAYSNIGVLPLDWGEIRASKTDRGIQVEWQTFNEHNVSHFEVERSTNGTNFKNLARVEYSDQRTGTSNWIFTDTNPLSGTNYYRIKSADHDLYASYSPVVTARFQPSGKDDCPLLLFPNPANDVLFLAGISPTANRLTITDNLGQIVMQKDLESAGISTGEEFQIDITALSPGVYYLFTGELNKNMSRFIIR